MSKLDERKLQMKGHLQFTVLEKSSGKILQKFSSHNVITDNGVIATLKLLGNIGVGGNLNPITKIGFGSNGDAEGVSDTALTDAYIRELVHSQVEDDGKSVTFDFELGTEEDNPAIIREMGLVCEDGTTLFSRRTIAVAIEKNENIAVSGSWTISIEQEVNDELGRRK